MRIVAWLAIVFVWFAAPSRAHAESLDLRLRGSTALLAGSAGDEGSSVWAKVGYSVVGTVGGFGLTLVMLPVIGSTPGAGGSLGFAVGSLVLYTVLLQADAWLFGVEQSWWTSGVGTGLGIVTGFALGYAFSKVFNEGDMSDLAAAIFGMVFGTAIAAPIWALIDPFGLTLAASAGSGGDVSWARPVAVVPPVSARPAISIPLVSAGF